jgi:hypothetical protein
MSHFPALAPCVVSKRNVVDALLAPGPMGFWLEPEPHRPSNSKVACGSGTGRGKSVPFEVLDDPAPGQAAPVASVRYAPPGLRVGILFWNIRS